MLTWVWHWALRDWIKSSPYIYNQTLKQILVPFSYLYLGFQSWSPVQTFRHITCPFCVAETVSNFMPNSVTFRNTLQFSACEILSVRKRSQFPPKFCKFPHDYAVPHPRRHYSLSSPKNWNVPQHMKLKMSSSCWTPTIGNPSSTILLKFTSKAPLKKLRNLSLTLRRKPKLFWFSLRRRDSLRLASSYCLRTWVRRSSEQQKPYTEL